MFFMGRRFFLRSSTSSRKMTGKVQYGTRFVSGSGGAKMKSEDSILAPVRVWRGGPGETGHYDTFMTPYEEGMSVLDALRWIRLHADSSLAVRYSCINANACKTCMVLVDGEVEYS